MPKANHYEIVSFLNYIYVLIEFTIKILLIIFDSLIFGGIFLFCFFYIYEIDYYLLSNFLRILILITFFFKLISYYLFEKISIRFSKILVVERFVATISAYLLPLYILWNTPTLYINKEISDINYILMLIFFIVGISVEKKFIFRKKLVN